MKGDPFFFSDVVEVWSKDFPIDEGIEFRQEVIDLIDFVELVFDIEEGGWTLVHKIWNKKGELAKNTHFYIPYGIPVEVPLILEKRCLEVIKMP